jgi:hypothetical protein
MQWQLVQTKIIYHQRKVFFKKLQIYYIFIDPKSPEILSDVRVIPRRFFFWAFVLGLVWVLYNRLWLVAVALVSILYVLLKLVDSGVIDSVTYQIVYFSIFLYLGFDASSLLHSQIEKSGFVLKGVMLASSQEKAEMKFCESYLNS